jgi:hypothetical protein
MNLNTGALAEGRVQEIVLFVRGPASLHWIVPSLAFVFIMLVEVRTLLSFVKSHEFSNFLHVLLGFFVLDLVFWVEILFFQLHLRPNFQ